MTSPAKTSPAETSPAKTPPAMNARAGTSSYTPARTTMPASFDALFHPVGVAIIGASSDPTRIGGHPVRALQRAAYPHGIYPVNPNRDEIAGLKAYPRAAAIGKRCDLAIIAVPAARVVDAIHDCGEAGIKFAVVLTAGFRETKGEGLALEAALSAACAETGVRIIGPNCQGMISVPARMFGVFGSVAEETDLTPGGVSCCFQSGGFGYAIVNLAERQGVGFRYCLSTGNETDLTTPQLLSGMLDDEGTDLAFAYMEGTPDARALLDVGAKSLQTGKPVLIWKAANTASGATAAASHTANMTGSYDLYRAAFRQAGLIEVHDVEEITDLAMLVAQGRLPAGNRVGVMSISGGSGIVFADRAVHGGLELPAFSETTARALAEIVPAFGSIENPADVTAGVFNDMSLFTRTLDVVLDDPGIDQLAILLASIPGAPVARAAEAIVAAAARTHKPVHVAWSGRPEKSMEAAALFKQHAIPTVPTPVRLATAAATLARFAADRRRADALRQPAVAVPDGIDKRALYAARDEGAAALSEAESKALIASYGVPITREVSVPAGDDPVRLSANLRRPLAVKVLSREIAHKTEVGGIRLGLTDDEGVRRAALAVSESARAARPDAKIEGVLVSEMAEGLEVLIGVVVDENFGPCVALALGGVMAEALQDVTHAIAPFGPQVAHDMMDRLAGRALFDGFRGAPPADREALAKLLVRVSHMAADLADEVAEIDINPVFVRPRGEGVVAADALVVLAQAAGSPAAAVAAVPTEQEAER
ncbi:MAG: acetate--CoA ligase family protein [Pseudomonadota bacterium]